MRKVNRPKWQSVLSYALAMLLTMIATTSANPLRAHAFEQVKTDIMQEEEVCFHLKQVNPLYEDVIAEEDLLTEEDLAAEENLLVWEKAQEETAAGEKSAEVGDVSGNAADSETDLYVFSAQGYSLNDTIYTNMEDAVLYVRSQMVNRVNEVKFTITDQGLSLSDLLNSIVNQAMEHTGNAREGDSIRYQWAGWSANALRNYSGGVTNYTLTIVFTYHTTAEQEQELQFRIQECLTSIDLDGKNSYERVCAIYDYIAEHVTYDYDNLSNSDYKLKYTAYAALINHTAVCQGYAVLLYEMLLEAGVDCRVINGMGNGGDHAWNIIRAEDKYYNADATWDSGYLKSGYYHYWFMKCEDNFGNHIRDKKFLTEDFQVAYPMGESDYEYNPEDFLIRILMMSGIEKPEAGVIQTTDGVTVSTRGIDALDIHWETADGRVLAYGERFVAGTAYKLCISLETKPDYTLSDDVEIMLNVQPDNEGTILEGTNVKLAFGLASDLKKVSFYETADALQPYVVKTVEKGSVLASVPEPSREGYIWKGWFLDKQLTQPYSYASYLVMSDMEVYGSWTQIPLTGTVSVTGTPVYGKSLMAKVKNSNVSDSSLKYQWKRGTAIISGATVSTYMLTKEDVGQIISCEVSSGQAFGSISGTADAVVDREEGPASPTGLTGKAVSASGVSDGQIIGVSAAMEYATKVDFSDKLTCGGSVVSGLAAGTYYVRVAETSITKAGVAAEVVVEDVGEVILGDMNGDNTVDAKDRMYLARALAGWSGYTLPGVELADLTDDGKVDAKDRMYLARKLAGWSGYE